MSVAGEKYIPVAEPLGQADLKGEIRQLHEEIALLREQVSRSGQMTDRAAPNAAVERVKQLKAQVDTAVAQAQVKADDIERQLRRTVSDKPVTVITISAALGYFLALLTWPYARRNR